MEIKDLEYKEMKLRECFKKKLETLNVDGDNNMQDVKCIKLYGVLWHLTHQLVMAEKQQANKGYTTSADTMNIQATGLKMGGTK